MTIRNRLALPVAFAAALLLFAAPAAADGWHHGWYKHHHHHCEHGGYAPVYVEHGRGYPVYYHSYDGAPAWFCRPCGHYFDSYDDLHYHVHVFHQVPLVVLPSLIVHATFDW